MGEGNLFRTALHFGSLSGISVIAFYIALYISGLSIFGQASLLGIWIPVVFLIMSTRFHRDHNLNGSLTYRQGLSIGFLTSMFNVLLFGLFFYVFGTLFDSGLIEAYKTQAAASLEEGKSLLSEKMIDKAMEGIDTITITSLTFSEAFNKFMGGVISTLVISAIFRRNPKPVNEV